MILKQRTKVTKRMTAEARLENPNIRMDEFEGRLRAAGNQILARDDERRVIVVAQAMQESIVEAGTFIPDAEAVAAGLLPASTKLVPCPDCKDRDGVAFRACTQCTNGKGTDGDPICRNCDGGGNELGGPCRRCGGHAVIAEA